jgi:hypothetical protein
VAFVRINLILASTTAIARSTFTVVHICFTLVADEACRTVARERWHTKLVATNAAVKTRARLALVIILLTIVALKAIRASTNVSIYMVNAIV